MSMGHTYKFFGFSISYTILTLPLSISDLPIVLLIPCTFSSISPLPLSTDNPPCDHHFCDSVPVLFVCLLRFCFLSSVVDSCEFVVILLFIVLIFFIDRLISFLPSFFLYLIFREKGRERERKGEKYQWVVVSSVIPTGDQACNPGMCPDWKLNQWPFGLQAGTQSTEPYQLGQHFIW